MSKGRFSSIFDRCNPRESHTARDDSSYLFLMCSTLVVRFLWVNHCEILLRGTRPDLCHREVGSAFGALGTFLRFSTIRRRVRAMSINPLEKAG